jgi:hypothetical protein
MGVQLSNEGKTPMRRHHAPAVLGRLRAEANFTHVKTLTSAVTTTWGVNWDEVYIARDLMQNFFDANRDSLPEIRVERDGTDVRISAPSPFNLERLFYLGSEKGEEDIGQYGEGFKVAATCLLRDHAVTPVAASGRDVLCLRIADQAVADTQLYPVEYDFYRCAEEVPGTLLLLSGCSRKLAQALSQGLSHFFHPENPLLGPRRWSDYRDGFVVYEATDGKGHVFYRGLKRGEIDDIPLVLVINKKYEAIERKVSKDRDRNAFGDEVMDLCYRHFARYGLGGRTDGQRVIVEAARRVWPRGHSLLSALADASHAWPSTLAREVFGDGYYARCSSADPTEQLDIDRLERRWRDEGKQCLPAYFGRFSALNAKDELRRAREKALEESKRQDQRAPTTAEMECVRVLARALRELAPEIGAVFDKGRTNYTVAQTEALLGQLKSGRGYRSREVFLGAGVFVADFPAALATFLHEHAHIFGHDGSRGFTDALTELLETVLRCRRDLDRYEAAWTAASEAVRRERESADRDPGDGPALDWLEAMGEAELRRLLLRLPTALLQRLRNGAAKGGER